MTYSRIYRLIGIIAVVMALTGAVISIGHFFDNKYIGWALIGAALALAIINVWLNIRYYRRKQNGRRRP